MKYDKYERKQRREYYNDNEFDNIMKFYNTHPLLAKERLKAYLKQYPGDVCARSYYLMLRMKLGEYNAVKEEYPELLNDSSQLNHIHRSNNFKRNLVIIKSYLLAAEESYEELYNLVNEKTNEFNDPGYIKSFCEIKLGTFTAFENLACYKIRQWNRYNEEEFFEHIKPHLADYNDVSNENATFNVGFPINDVINEVKKYIPSDKKYGSDLFSEMYYFKYDNCGHTQEGIVDYFKVVCFSNNHNMITIYPIIGNENLPYVDLNYMQKTEGKVKKISRIELFNKKYNF